MSNKLSWYFRRLSRMQPAEIIHRFGEQARRRMDMYRRFGWTAFEGPACSMSGLPALTLTNANPDLIAAAKQTRAKIEAGECAWLGQRWPPMGADWKTTLWTLDPVSGTHWPGSGNGGSGYRDAAGRGDVKFVWEPNRLQMLQPLALLAANGDASATDLAYAILEGWMAANPPYDGVNWSSGIEAASRIVSVIVLLGAGAPADPKRSAMLRRFFAAHARKLARFPSLYSSANNHRISELGALLLVRLCMPDLKFQGPDKIQLLTELEDEVQKQFHSDGVGAEQSPTYASYTLEWFLLSGIAAEASGMSPSPAYKARLGLAVDHLLWLMDDAGKPPRIGDDDEGRVLAIGLSHEPRYVSSVTALGLRWLAKRQPPAKTRDPDLRDLLAPATQPNGIDAALVGAKTFADGGITAVRHDTRHGTAVLTLDHGPLGFLSIAAHGHADALAMTLSLGPEPVIVDPGTYLYHSGGAMRDLLRGTGAHNTLQIEDADQSSIVGPFAWSKHARTRLIEHDANHVKAICEGWQARFGVSHQRQVAWDWPKIRIEDHLTGTPTRPLKWKTGLSLAPGFHITLDGTTATIETPLGRKLTVTSDALPWQRVPAIYSPAFNEKMPIDRLELTAEFAPGANSEVAAFSIAIIH